jgi:hypothetical protein
MEVPGQRVAINLDEAKEEANMVSEVNLADHQPASLSGRPRQLEQDDQLRL